MKSDYKKLLEELKAAGQRDVVPIETIEQDYAISFLLRKQRELPECHCDQSKTTATEGLVIQ